MSPLFVSDPVASAVLACALAAFVYSEYRLGRTHPGRPELSRDQWSGAAVGVGLVAVYVGGAVVSVLVRATVIAAGAWWWFAVGLVIAAVGQGMRLRAVHELGTAFTVRVQTAPGQQVVDTGLYRLIRHPSYTGALICGLGFTIAYTNWLSPLMVLVLAGAYVLRIPHEERVLIEGLGAPYRSYLGRTKRLIPFLL